jgi:hypothetical protein
MANEAELLEQEPVVQEEPEPSLRDVIEDAVDEHAESPPSQESTGSTPTEVPSTAPTPLTSEAPAPSAPTPTPSQATPPAELKAPSQWKPAVREQWNRIPRQVQEEIIRREGDSMRLIGSVGPKIRMADFVANEVAPFTEQLQSAGISPQSFIGDIFSSVRYLTSGTPQERAEVVANIVSSYGVDVRLLDGILSQRINLPPEVNRARQILAREQVQQHQQKQTVDYQNALEAEKSIAAFGADPKHEFLEQVRDLMADLIQAGRAQNLDDAYASAIWAHPDTRKILLQREAESRAMAKNRRAAIARVASSSVSGSPSLPGGNQPNPANMSLRQSIEAAFDEHSSL